MTGYRLRSTVRASAGPQGVLLHNWDRTLRLDGGLAARALFAALEPRLRRGATLPELRAAVPPSGAAVVTALVTELARHRMLLTGAAAAAQPPGGEDGYAGTARYLEATAEAPRAALDRLLGTVVLVTGHGRTFDALLRGLAAAGARRLTPWRPVGGRLPAPPREDAGLVVHAQDGADLRPLRETEAAAAAAGLPVLAGVTMPGAGLLGLAGRDPDDVPLSEAAGRLTGPPPGLPGAGLPPALPAVVGGLLAAEATTVLAGTPGRLGHGRLLLVQAGTLTVTRHRMPAAPPVATTSAAALPAALHAAAARRGGGQPGTVLAASEPFTDDRFGALSAPWADSLGQLPLNAARVQVRPYRRWPARTALGFGFDADEARCQALVQGLRILAGDLLPPGPVPALPLVDLAGRSGWRAARSHLAVAVGRGDAGWLADGLRRVLRRRYLAADPDFEFGPAVPAAPPTAAPAAEWWELAGGPDAQARCARSAPVPGCCVGQVGGGPDGPAVAVAGTPRAAVAAAAVRWLARTQSAGGAGAVPWHRFGTPALPGPGPGSGGPGTGAGAWASAVVEALHRAGWTVVVHPLRLAPELTAAGLRLGVVGIARGGGRGG
jgi:hypothetical protein